MASLVEPDTGSKKVRRPAVSTAGRLILLRRYVSLRESCYVADFPVSKNVSILLMKNF